MADKESRPTVVIRTIEGRATAPRAGMSTERYQEQVRKLAASGVRVPEVRRGK